MMFTHRVLSCTRQPWKTYSSRPNFLALHAYSTTTLPNGITVAYDLHEPPYGKSSRNAPPIIFLHGLFGSKMNNRSMSKYGSAAANTPLNGHFLIS